MSLTEQALATTGTLSPAELAESYRNAAVTHRRAGYFDTARLFDELAIAAEQGRHVETGLFRGLTDPPTLMLTSPDYRRARRAFYYGEVA